MRAAWRSALEGVGEADKDVDPAHGQMAGRYRYRCRPVAALQDVEEGADGDEPASGKLSVDQQLGSHRRSVPRQPKPHHGRHYRGNEHDTYYRG
jgi:hypothetical protein